MAPLRSVARFMTAKATMTVRNLNLVVPLANEATATRTTETPGGMPARSGAVSPLIGPDDLRQGDVDSTTGRSTPATRLTPGARTSTTATRTTTTRTMSFVPVPSADYPERPHADITFTELVKAYFDCRKSKRNSTSALAFEINQERNLALLFDDLTTGTYRPGPSICFVITHPKPREVWAADFRDRIVHHLMYNRIAPQFYRRFVADSCACIPGRGTLYAAERLEAKIRSATENWSKQAFYLKCDLANFFVSIDKRILWSQLEGGITNPWSRWLAHTILFHDPRENFRLHGSEKLLQRVPPHKRLTGQDAYHGLPIGNLSSQFFANVYLDALDQFVKHRLHCRHYIRYVDDFVLIHESADWLNQAKAEIEAFLSRRLHAQLNPTKTILQPVARGIDFVGQIIKPWHRRTRRRTVKYAIRKIETLDADRLFETANSYFGLFRQASHGYADQAKLANAMRRHGYSVKSDLTKTYRRPT